MSDRTANVLLPGSWPTQNLLRCAVSKIICSVLAVAGAEVSDGGARVTHKELLDMLPDLRAAITAMNSLVVRAERIAA